MELFPVLGDQVRDGNGINDSLVRMHGVYAGISRTLQKTKTELCARMNFKPCQLIFIEGTIHQNQPKLPRPFDGSVTL